MRTVRRVEWRGELFAADLPSVLVRLAETPVVPYELPHTLTIFLEQRCSRFDLERTLRVRSYCQLPDLQPESVHRAVAEGLSGKLQFKAATGATTELVEGRVALPSLRVAGSHEGWLRIVCAGAAFEPSSVRVARRAHYVLPRRQTRATVRVTVDHERALFRVVDGSLQPLGDMGPRVEIKSADGQEVDRVLGLVNPDGMLRRVRYRSLELLFRDLLRDRVSPAQVAGKPEIELKFSMAAVAMDAAASMVIRWLGHHPEAQLLLPFPHQIVRLRRYHFCAPSGGDAQCSVVETAAGRLSAKMKRGDTGFGSVLVRQTQASHDTDRDGALEPVEAFVLRHGWRHFNTMTKVQAKIPLSLASGNVYLVSVDDCVDVHGTALRQLELEFIGSVSARSSTAQVCTELESFGSSLRHALPDLDLRPTMESKFAFYRDQVRS